MTQIEREKRALYAQKVKEYEEGCGRAVTGSFARNTALYMGASEHKLANACADGNDELINSITRGVKSYVETKLHCKVVVDAKTAPHIRLMLKDASTGGFSNYKDQRSTIVDW